MTIPPFDFPIADKNNPKMDKGIPIQFSHPKNGIRPITIKNKATIPKRRPIVFMNYNLIAVLESILFNHLNGNSMAKSDIVNL